jgi:hypothetical protein
MLSEGAGVVVVIVTSAKLFRVSSSVIRASLKIASSVADASRGWANETKKPYN